MAYDDRRALCWEQARQCRTRPRDVRMEDEEDLFTVDSAAVWEMEGGVGPHMTQINRCPGCGTTFRNRPGLWRECMERCGVKLKEPPAERDCSGITCDRCGKQTQMWVRYPTERICPECDRSKHEEAKGDGW